MPLLNTHTDIAAAIRECVATRAHWTIVADTQTGRDTLTRAATLLLLAGTPEPDVRVATFRVLHPRVAIRSTVALLLIPKAALDGSTLRAVLSMVGAVDLPPANGTRDVICLDAGNARLAVTLGNIASGRAKLVGDPERN